MLTFLGSIYCKVPRNTNETRRDDFKFCEVICNAKSVESYPKKHNAVGKNPTYAVCPPGFLEAVDVCRYNQQFVKPDDCQANEPSIRPL